MGESNKAVDGTAELEQLQAQGLEDLFGPMGNAVVEKLRAQGEACLLDEKDPYEIDLTQPPKAPVYSIKSNGIGAFSLGDIQAFKAKSKNGKTWAVSIIAAVILGADFGQLQAALNDTRVLFFDTEQNPNDTYRVITRMHRLLGWSDRQNVNRLHGYALRGIGQEHRQEYIETKVETIKPTAIVIDGIADLLTDFNDIKESNKLIEWLMKLSEGNECAVIVVLHENKSKDDSGMKGHLGTLLLQKASDVYRCEKKGDLFTVTATDCRHFPIDDFAFMIDEDGTPVDIPTEKKRAESEKMEEQKDLFKKIFDEAPKGLSSGDVVEKYIAITSQSKSTALRRLKDAVKNGYVSKSVAGIYEYLDDI